MGARCICRHKTSAFGMESKREEHKAIDTGSKDQQMPNSFFSFSGISHNVPESQATVPDRPGVPDASSGLFQCFHVTSPSRTAKIKHVSASRTTGGKAQKHVRA